MRLDRDINPDGKPPKMARQTTLSFRTLLSAAYRLEKEGAAP